MAQLTGSGPGNGTNYAMVDNSLGTNDGRLWTNSITDAGSLALGNKIKVEEQVPEMTP